MWTISWLVDMIYSWLMLIVDYFLAMTSSTSFSCQQKGIIFSWSFEKSAPVWGRNKKFIICMRSVNFSWKQSKENGKQFRQINLDQSSSLWKSTYYKMRSWFYGKISIFSVKSTPLPKSKELISRNFWAQSRFIVISTQCTVWKLRKFTLTVFWQKFRENNAFTK